jgi:hypothetical protein
VTVFGIDHAWGRPGPAALKKAGAHFVCRYLSHDTTGKNLTKAEASLLSDNRIWIVVVWESTSDRALAGHSAGVADAQAAVAQARACGMPAGRPIYFAVDFDATAAQQAAINAYLDGAASEIGRDRVGLYAGYYVIKRAFDAKKITWGWQTYAWSGGHWDSRRHIEQYSNDHKINGVGVDYNRATRSDYGQWRVGVTPKEEDDVFTADDKKWLTETLVPEVVKAVLTTDIIPAPGSNPDDPWDPAHNPGFDPAKNKTWAGQSVGKQTIQGLIAIDNKLTGLGEGAGTVDVDALADKLAAKVAPLVADVLAKRLET